MKVKTLKKHSYNGKFHHPGHEYEISNKMHIRVLEAIKKIQRVSKKTVPETATSCRKRDQKGRYKRKDMTAESTNSDVLIINETVKC